MPSLTSALRAHLADVLEWEDAHVTFDKAVDGIPLASQGARADGFPHSPWELLEHMRLAQDDIVEFCNNAAYEHTKAWPGDYWPRTPAPPTATAWADSVAAYLQGREALKAIARTVEDLTQPVPTGSSRQTYLRAILLAADHTAYHVGQLVLVRRALGHWPQ
ncbi:DinB superfamily protein [Luteitalea pratensis]|uniref:DinB superfamily protein n=1 Tax=Luteitalea pratensis TaxID=1855912 RepID=A0A143PTS7_LUTPR|nr:DinB family protein [Luteitalea pratensis]AMY11992.1 DinB superfamily protein [Luteitalea pratensis]